MAIKDLKFDFKADATEQPALLIQTISDPTVIHQITGTNGTLTPVSSTKISKVWGDEVTLVGGAHTIDLEALDAGNLPNITFAGLKVNFVKIKANPNNSATPLVFKPGVANGYNIFGTATGEIQLGAGDVVMFLFNEILDDVAAADSEIDVTGGTTDKFDIILGAG